MPLSLKEAEVAAYADPSQENLAVYVKLLEETLEDAGPDVSAYLDEARAGFPAEDCLEEVIQLARGIAGRRVTKSDVLDITEKLEQLQTELWQSAEYGAEQLDKAARGDE